MKLWFWQFHRSNFIANIKFHTKFSHDTESLTTWSRIHLCTILTWLVANRPLQLLQLLLNLNFFFVRAYFSPVFAFSDLGGGSYVFESLDQDLNSGNIFMRRRSSSILKSRITLLKSSPGLIWRTRALYPAGKDYCAFQWHAISEIQTQLMIAFSLPSNHAWLLSYERSTNTHVLVITHKFVDKLCWTKKYLSTNTRK